MDECLGQHCEKIGLKKSHLNNTSLISPQDCDIENGVILELFAQCSLTTLISVLTAIKPELASVHPNTLKSKVSRVVEIKKRLVSKKKVKGVSSVAELKQQVFEHTSLKQSVVTNVHKNNISNSCEQESHKTLVITSPKRLPIHAVELQNSEIIDSGLQSARQCDSDQCSKEERKLIHLHEYELTKKRKALRKVKTKIQTAKEQLNKIQQKTGHYSVRNINKRDERARRNLKDLKETQRQLIRQKKVNEACIHATEQLKTENNRLKSKKQEVQSGAWKALEQKKVNAQKSASYYRVRASTLKEDLTNRVSENEEIRCLKSVIASKNNEIERLNMDIECMREKVASNCIQGRSNDGSFSDSIRMCVIELTGLEVACEKVTPVIQTVAKHLFGLDIPNADLPTSTTVQTIVDEGHYLAKTFISQKLAEADSWGLNRDGTTRKKQKIVDTSVTLSSGEIMSLGFSRVAHETADTIHAVTKDQLNELADLNLNDESAATYLKLSLQKLGFTMSDRASNEKKADRLLDEWRDDVLKNCDENCKQQVLHFHCMAHVLLGFHRYACMDLKEYEATISSEHGKLGREGLSVFKFWNQKGTAAERTLRMVSEVFGPSGDHHGVRDLWEAHCAANGIKSTIGNYRDNRFNALFQTAAEVYLHKDDFVTVLQNVKNPNLKLKSVLADLTSLPIVTLVQCLGLFYLKVTGPYWNLVTDSDVPYLELYKDISALNSFLDLCEKEPAILLQLESHWTEEDKHNITHIHHKEAFAKRLSIAPEGELYKLLMNAISVTARAMRRTVNKQLSDFLPGGPLHQSPSSEELKRTDYAQVTNLGCEHHFGDLDSSQRRRPSASFHHHSTIQLLKRSRKGMMAWLQKMPDEQRCELLKVARKGGKELRQKHRNQEKSVLTQINNHLSEQASSKKRKATNEEKSAKRTRKCEEKHNVRENEYVAVAYQDSWYPGIVTKLFNDKMQVKFMKPASKFGTFSWPGRDDIQTVELAFVLISGFVPNCVSSGRLWHISETEEIVTRYEEFCDMYF